MPSPPAGNDREREEELGRCPQRTAKRLPPIFLHACRVPCRRFPAKDAYSVCPPMLAAWAAVAVRNPEPTEEKMGEAITETTKPRIYVACLAAYNNGILHGHWVDAEQGAWAIWDGIRRMLAASPIADAEEWAIHDYEGFGSLLLSEFEGIERVGDLAAFIVEHGALGCALLEHFSGDIEEAREAMADRYLGAHASLADYVQDLTEETTAIPPALRYYIDWQALARDAEMSGDVFTVSTAFDVVHVFAGC